MARNRIEQIASLIDALKRCEKNGNDFAANHRETLEGIARNCLPSGSGFDNGTKIDVANSKPERIVLETSFHHMDGDGFYNGWTNHAVIVTPSLVHGFNMRVTGTNENNIKEYIGDVFSHALSTEID